MNSVSTGSSIHVEDVRDLRTALDAALSTLNIQTSSYTDNTLVGYSEDPLTATLIKAVHIRELRSRVTSNVGTTGSGGSGAGLVYVLSDVQGSTRAVMNNAGSSSAVVARHDYLPFGEEIGSGIGSRSSGQGYSATDQNRWKYAMTERDATSGLDHTWFRKYESLSGRWTSPDPLSGAIADPQSFNHYSYSANDPVNRVDSSGLFPTDLHSDWIQANSGSWEVNVYPNDSPVEIPGSGDLHVSWFDRRELIVPQNLAPLPDKQNTNLIKAASALASRLAAGVSEDCQKNVIDKLKSIGFDLKGFISFLGNDPRFYNGLTSQALAAGTVSPKQPADLLYGPGATIADVFKGSGTSRPNALTSITSRTFLSFFRPDAINGSGAGTQGTLFHEGIHGFTGKVDADIQNALGIKETPVSQNITDYIRKHCF
jgi:RHS repeat-associated protein